MTGEFGPEMDLERIHLDRLEDPNHQVYLGVAFLNGAYAEFPVSPDGGWYYKPEHEDCNHPPLLVIHSIRTDDYVERIEISHNVGSYVVVRMYHNPEKVES